MGSPDDSMDEVGCIFTSADTKSADLKGGKSCDSGMYAAAASYK